MTLNLAQLLSLIEEMSDYGQLIERKESRRETNIVMLDAAKAYLIAALCRSRQLPTFVITAQPENAKKLYEQLSVWSDSPISFFPEPDALPYERITSDVSTELERVRVLSVLANCGQDRGNSAPSLVITSAPALMGKTVSYADFVSTCHTLEVGMEIEPLYLLSRWETMGYKRESIVEIPGTMSQRGGIIDIYPPTSELPARLEFFGNTVESLRLFDPVNQRSLKVVSEVAVGPATELLKPWLSEKSELERVLNGIDLSGCNAEMSQQLQQEIAML
ncbi:transcription-repair coupling factor, partial [Chloroflexota bacterium]